MKSITRISFLCILALGFHAEAFVNIVADANEIYVQPAQRYNPIAGINMNCYDLHTIRVVQVGVGTIFEYTSGCFTAEYQAELNRDMAVAVGEIQKARRENMNILVGGYTSKHLLAGSMSPIGVPIKAVRK